MSEWIPVKDQFPPLDKELIICRGSDVVFFNPSAFPNPSSIIKEFVSHWMPKPLPPKDYTIINE